MYISDNIVREQLKNVYFLSGGAYGGKTTMAKLLEEKYGFLRYRQGDHWDRFASVADPEHQPAMSMDRSKDWHGFFAQSPADYSEWLERSTREEAEFAIADLIRLSGTRKVIADVNIPVDILRDVADYRQVVILFAPEEMTRRHCFDRADKDEVFRFILSFPDGEQLLDNVIEALHYNSEAKRHEYVNSGFRYIQRRDDDTIERMLGIIEGHFELSK